MLTTLVILLVVCVGYLVYRVNELERRLPQADSRVPNMDNIAPKAGAPRRTRPTAASEADVINVVNHLYAAILRPEPVELENVQAAHMRQALTIIDHYIGHRLFSHVPALRQVVSFSIGLDRKWLRDKTGIGDDDLQGLEGQLAPAVFWPASSMVVEEWATHSVVRDFSGPRDVLYADRTQYRQELPFLPVPVWQHVLPKRAGEWDEAYMEVVLHAGYIKFWARDGRFGRRIPPEPEALEENTFVSIPLNEDRLAEYRWIPQPRRAEDRWIRRYAYTSPDESVRWQLTVHDMVDALR